MIIIILGFFVGLIIGFACNNLWVFITVLAISIILPMFPLEGFEEKECIKKVKLIYLTSKDKANYLKFKEKENRVYLVADVYEDSVFKATYAFDNREAYELNSVAYEECIVKGNIKIYESSSCEFPILKKFKTKPVRSVVAIAPFSTKHEIVFQVPEGTVIRNFNKY